MNNTARSRIKVVVAVIGAIVLACVVAFPVQYQKMFIAKTNGTRTQRTQQQFPVYQPGELSAEQQKLLQIVKKQVDTQPAGTVYSEGATEPWCANFVSWVAKQNGTPFVNPVSGSWRMPGTLTLKSYFITKGQWHPYGNGYVPKPGDVAIYDGNGPHGQHTNFVLKYSNNQLITAGGNENGKVRVQSYPLNDQLHVVGFAAIL